jgi:hypothetical protein
MKHWRDQLRCNSTRGHPAETMNLVLPDGLAQALTASLREVRVRAFF